MKIKRFIAPDMRTALQHVRQEHGPDAVILSNRVTPEGVEIVAASQYDEDQVRENATPAPSIIASTELPAPPAANSAEAIAPADATAEPATTEPDTLEVIAAADIPLSATAPLAVDAAEADNTPAALPEPAPVAAIVEATPEVAAAAIASEPVAEAAMPAPAAAESSAPAPVAAIAEDAPHSTTNAPWSQLQTELAHMRQLLERGLHQMGDERLRASPARQLVMDRLEEHGFSASVIRDLAQDTPADLAPQHVCEHLQQRLNARLPLADDALSDAGGVFALIGPSGAGKTTLAGKLAARYSARHGVRDVALVSFDCTGTGGNERLYSLGRELGVVVHAANSQEALAALLQRLADYRLVLIDTGNDAHANASLSATAASALLVLSGNTHPADLDTAVQRFQPANPQAIALTRLDDSSQLGSALSVAITRQLPLAWISDGQNLEGSLHAAKDADLLGRLSALHRAPENAPYDPVAALVANHAFA